MSGDTVSRILSGSVTLIPTLPPDVMRSLSLPAVSKHILLVKNSILVSVSPVWTIFCATFKLPENVPVEPAIVPQLIFGVPLNPVALPVKLPTNVVAVSIPVTTAPVFVVVNFSPLLK